jgi:hypothetical protein
MAYENTFIYVLRVGDYFQYLFCLGNKDYSHFVKAPVSLFTRCLKAIGLVQDVFTEDQLEQLEQVVLSGAMQAIDELKNPTEKVSVPMNK